jgi:tryptophan halogenase
MLYQGIRPEHYHYLATAMGDNDLVRFLDNIRTTIRQAVDRMPTHQEFVDHYARAGDDIWNKPAM